MADNGGPHPSLIRQDPPPDPCMCDCSFKRSLGNGVGESMFLMWTPGTRGEPMFAGGHFFSVLTTGVVSGRPEWPISSDTDWWN